MLEGKEWVGRSNHSRPFNVWYMHEVTIYIYTNTSVIRATSLFPQPRERESEREMGRRRAGNCSNGGSNRRAWTAMEDKILTEYIKIHGAGQWNYLPEKTGEIVNMHIYVYIY